MSPIEKTDTLLVQRGTTLHSAPLDLAGTQDTDLLLINRAGVDYKCSIADWKAGQSGPPVIGSVSLADVAGGARFTSQAFPATVTMTDDGKPASTKTIKAWVEGALKTQALSNTITSVGQSAATPARFYDMRAGGDGSAGVPEEYSKQTAIASGLVFGSGPSSTDSYTMVYYKFDIPTVPYFVRTSGQATPPCQIWASDDGITWSDLVTTTYTPGPGDESLKGKKAAYYYAWRKNGVAMSVNIHVCAGLAAVQQTVLTFAAPHQLAGFVVGEEVTEVGNGNNGMGTITAINTTAGTMQLGAIEPNWDVGSKAGGPLKAPPGGVTSRMYCTLNGTGGVTALQSPDPGYTAISGTSPYSIAFPALFPTGDAPDTTLPAGTTVTVAVQATNASGTSSKTSNTVTPA